MILSRKLPKLAKLGTVQNPLRFTDILPPRAMKSGREYESWKCNNEACEQPIVPRRQRLDRPALVLSIKCPHCGNEDLYRWSARSEHQYAVKGAAGT